MKAMRIGIDIDEVLAPFLPTMKRWRPPKVQVPQRHKYLYRDVYKISERESVKMVRDFYNSEDFMNMPPIDHAYETLMKLKKENKLYIVTGRQEVVRDKTQSWIQDNFPGVFHDIIMTNSFTSNEIPKGDMCKLLNIGLMIDDSIDVCHGCLEQRIPVMNFIGDPMYPWCDETLISVRSWKAVSDILT